MRGDAAAGVQDMKLPALAAAIAAVKASTMSWGLCPSRSSSTPSMP
jgi:hypothetical protein